jgi:transcriptional regulator with XRE-family HTH domain
MPIRNITPSSYVGPQVRKWRDRRGWSQQDLANRLHELGAAQTGWSQTKVHKLEAGKLTRVLVDDVFELALALDVSPLYLLTPLEGHDEQGNTFKVWLGGKVDAWPWVVRQWIRGVQPILSTSNYRNDEAARSGQRFYLLESQPLSEWVRIAETGKEARRIRGVVTALESEPPGAPEGDDGE